MDDLANRLKHMEIKMDELLRNQRVIASLICKAHGTPPDSPLDASVYVNLMSESILPYNKPRYHRRNSQNSYGQN